jgi:hypothetical protein
VVCDGAGATKPFETLGDVPDDGNECTVDYCSPGPKHTLKATGTACSSGICDPAGACVAHIPVKCFAGGELYIDCDGLQHPYEVYYKINPNTTAPCSPPTDTGYCPIGAVCSVFQAGQTTFGTCK